MPRSDLTEDDYTELAGLVRAAIDAEPYRIGPRINSLRLLLAKLEPQRDEPAVTPYPAPRPSGGAELRLCQAEGRPAAPLSRLPQEPIGFAV